MPSTAGATQPTQPEGAPVASSSAAGRRPATEVAPKLTSATQPTASTSSAAATAAPSKAPYGSCSWTNYQCLNMIRIILERGKTAGWPQQTKQALTLLRDECVARGLDVPPLSKEHAFAGPSDAPAADAAQLSPAPAQPAGAQPGSVSVAPAPPPPAAAPDSTLSTAPMVCPGYSSACRAGRPLTAIDFMKDGKLLKCCSHCRGRVKEAAMARNKRRSLGETATNEPAASLPPVKKPRMSLPTAPVSTAPKDDVPSPVQPIQTSVHGPVEPPPNHKKVSSLTPESRPAVIEWLDSLEGLADELDRNAIKLIDSLKIPTTGSFPDKFHGESAVLDKILQALADNRAALADALGRVSGAPKTKSAIQGVLDILKRATPATFPAGDSPTHLSEHWKLWRVRKQILHNLDDVTAITATIDECFPVQSSGAGADVVSPGSLILRASCLTLLKEAVVVSANSDKPLNPQEIRSKLKGGKHIVLDAQLWSVVRVSLVHWADDLVLAALRGKTLIAKLRRAALRHAD